MGPDAPRSPRERRDVGERLQHIGVVFVGVLLGAAGNVLRERKSQRARVGRQAGRNRRDRQCVPVGHE